MPLAHPGPDTSGMTSPATPQPTVPAVHSPGPGPRTGPDRRGRLLVVGLLVLTVGQLAVATFVPGLPQFEGKGFAARLVAYPAMMLVVPLVWWLRRGRGSDGGRRRPAPWSAFGWIMLPFLVDVTGNSLGLYDAVWWWDDANHLVNWLFLNLGLGLLMTAGAVATAPAWARVLLVTGVGAALAIGWEIGEYFAFIRGGTELLTAYTDTLGDEVLGTLGALLAGLLLARRAARPSVTG
jgi:hypothetical protein